MFAEWRSLRTFCISTMFIRLVLLSRVFQPLGSLSRGKGQAGLVMLQRQGWHHLDEKVGVVLGTRIPKIIRQQGLSGVKVGRAQQGFAQKVQAGVLGNPHSGQARSQSSKHI